MHQPSIVILGGGHMGGAMAARWHTAQAGQVTVVEQEATRRAALMAQGIRCVASIDEAPASDLLVLAVKPQQFQQIKPFVSAHSGRDNAVILSIMAGITLQDLGAIGPSTVRVMPNLPALIGESMSVACGPALSDIERGIVSDALAHIGALAWVEDEAQLHAVTAISGSGPGYVFAFMEALENAAIAQGLPPDLARALVTQTLKGAALLASASPEDAATLRAQVTSPGGTTEAAIATLTQGNFSLLIARAAAAASDRSRELAHSAPHQP